MRQLKITKQLTNRAEKSIDFYFQEINKYSLISPEEEVKLTMRIRDGDRIALEKLVIANLRFVISVAKQYQSQGLSFSDLINEGNLGLVKAATRFDETRGFKFISYAVWWIRQSIMQAIANQNRIVRLPLNKLSIINKIKKAIPYLEQELEREPSVAEIAEYTDLSREEVKIAIKIKNHGISFDKPLIRDDNNSSSLYDFVQTGNIPAPDHNIMKESLSTDIQRALNKLTKREANIIKMAFGLFGTQSYTLNDISEKYNITSECVRQIKSAGLFKLKKMLIGKDVFFEH